MSIIPDDQIDFHMRRNQPNLVSALEKAAKDIKEEGHIIFCGWRISDLLKEAAINLKFSNYDTYLKSKNS